MKTTNATPRTFALSNEKLKKKDQLELYDIRKKEKAEKTNISPFVWLIYSSDTSHVSPTRIPPERTEDVETNAKSPTARPCSVNRPTRVIAFNRVSLPARRNGQRRRTNGKGTFNSARDKYQKNRREGGGGRREKFVGAASPSCMGSRVLKYAIGWLYKGRVSLDT